MQQKAKLILDPTQLP